MDNHGFLRVAAAVPAVSPGDCKFNADHIIECATRAADRGAQVVVLPELAVTGYTCADLFHNRLLLDVAECEVDRICRESVALDALVVFGAPLRSNGQLYNCAVAVHRGEIKAIVAKTYLPGYNEFYEKRWFQPARDGIMEFKVGGRTVVSTPGSLIDVGGALVGIEICEDLWAPLPPSTDLALAGAQVILNLSASDDLIGKYAYLRSLIAQQSARCVCAYVYASAGYGESSTDLVFDGKAFIAENGSILEEAERWSTDEKMVVGDVDIEALQRDRMHLITFGDCATRTGAVARPAVEARVAEVARESLLRRVNPTPFVPASDSHIAERCAEITNIQVAALARRLDATHTKNLVIGVSGGLDSTLALLVAARTFDKLKLDRKGIVGVTMPGFGTTGRTYNNAVTLMKTLGITIREIPIAEAVMLHFRDIGHDAKITDVVYENSQARERTQILMDIANQVGGMVLGTGDLSELALGWATYNGDHMSMYAVNAGVPKTLVKYLVRHYADTSVDGDEKRALLDIVDTPISPELTPADDKGEIAQKTEDLVGPYDLHDFFLYYTLRYGFSPRRIFYLAQNAFPGRDKREIVKWLRTFFRRFFNQQFKRSCLPDGPKVGSVCLSPRGDWRMPSDASWAAWLREVEEIEKEIERG